MTIEHVATFSSDSEGFLELYYRSSNQTAKELFGLREWLTGTCRDDWRVDSIESSVMPDGSDGFLGIFILSERDAVMCRLAW